MTYEELKDIVLCGETSKVQFKQEWTSQKEIAKEMIAFANLHGGMILFGVKDKTGELIGLTYDDIQTISRELGNAANEHVRPTIYIETETLMADGKRFLICNIAQGKNKPYKNLSGEIWVRQGADKRHVTENSEILSLFQQSGAYHPERDAIPKTSTSDLEMAYINEYFTKVFGKEKEAFGMPLEDLLQSQGILAQSGEVTRAGMLFFGRHPQLFMPSVMIKAVAFVGNDIGGSEYRNSMDIIGTIPLMFSQGLSFLTSNLKHLQMGQNFNKVGILEIAEVVLEELLQNSLIHFDLLNTAAIRLLIFDNRVEIINPGCLYGGLQVKDILLGVSRQRNPLMATMASRTMIFRGLGSGVVRALREDVKIDFHNEESANQFKIVIWRKSDDKAVKSDDKVTISGDSPTESDDKTADSDDKVTIILNYLKEHKSVTTLELSKLLGIGTSGTKKYLSQLVAEGKIVSHGANRNRTYSLI